MQAKSRWFPQFGDRAGPGLSQQKDSARIDLESPRVEKGVNNRLKKRTGVRFLTFRTGYLHFETASKLESNGHFYGLIRGK